MRKSVALLRALTILVWTSLCASTGALGDDWPSWRGPERNGISKEKGLLREWPKEGPKLLWQAKDLGGGYSTPSVVGEHLYLVTNEGLESESVEARKVEDGSKVWSTRIGKVGKPDQQPEYPGARSTPTVDGDVLYALGSDGDLVCLDRASGDIRWKKSLRDESIGGVAGTWAYAESPLVDGDRLIVTPGGSVATMAAFDKKSGDLVWRCAVPGGGEAAYASTIIVEAAGAKQYVQLIQKGLIGVDASSGKLLWRYEKPVSRFNANIPTPLADDGIIYVGSAGTGGGAVKLKRKGDQIEARELYFGSQYPTSIGGSIKLGDTLYGTTGRAMIAIDFATGDVKWQERAIGAASMVLADGRIYLHGENGEVALVEPSPEGYREKGRFTPPNQPQRTTNDKPWAYPVVANGRLYIRDLDSLWCFDVRAKD